MSAKPFILVVDDNPDHRLLVQQALKRAGFEVDTAACGVEALEMVSSKTYGCMVLDYALPDMKGTETIRRMSKKGISVPVVMLTGAGSESIAVEAMKAGAADYLVKAEDYLRKLPLVVSRAIERERASEAARKAEAEVRERGHQLAALHQVSQAVSGTLDLKAVAASALEAALKVLDLDGGLIKIVDEATQELVLICDRGQPPEELAQALHAYSRAKLGQGLTGTVAQSGELLISDDIAHDPSTFHTATKRSGFTFHIGISLKVKGSVVGAMSLFSRRHRTFNPTDMGMIESIGNMVGMAIANARLYEEQKQHAEEVDALHQVGEAVVSQSLDLEAVSAVALEAVIKVLGLDGGIIRYLDESTQELVPLSHQGLSPEMEADRRTSPPPKVGESLVGIVAQSGHPLVVEDFSHDPRSIYESSRRSGIQSYVGIPLKTKDRVLGVISGVSNRGRTFSPTEIGMMESIGNMVGMAIANARLYEEQKHRMQEMAALHQVSQTVIGSLDMEAVSAVALEAVIKVLGLDGGVIRYLDESTQELVPLSHQGLPGKLVQEMNADPRMKIGQGLAGTVTQSGQPLVVGDLAGRTALTYYEATSHAGFRSFVGLPLRVADRIVGVISGFSRRQRTFTPAEMDMMANLGNMVGMAIANARLFGRVEAGAQEWERTFDSMSDGVSIHSPDFRIIRANLALARMLNTTTETLVGQHCYQVIHGLDHPIDECPLARCMVEKRACELVRQEPHLGNRWLHTRTAPVLDDRGELVSIVHTIRDITREKQQQESLERLYRLSRVLSSSLDLDTVLGIALEEVGHISGLVSATRAIALLDEWGQQGRIVAARGPHHEVMKGVSLAMSALPDDVKRLLFDDQRLWIMPDASQFSAVIKGLPRYSEYQTFAMLPLVVRGRATGVLLIGSPERWYPNSDEMALLETYAREIALAVENAGLHTRTDDALRRRVAELEALTGVLSAATRGLDLDAILKDALQRAADALGVERAGVMLLEGNGEMGVIVGTYQGSGTDSQGLGMKLQISALPMLQKVLQEGQPLVIDDIRELLEGGQRDLAELRGVRSVLMAPLMVRGSAIGTIQLTTLSAPRSYSPEEVGLAQAIAGHLASVVENVRLHQSTEEERSILGSVIASMGEGLVVVDAQGSLAYCNRVAENILGLNAADFLGQPVRVFNDLLSTRIIEPKDWRRALAAELEKAPSQQKFHFTVRMAEQQEVEATLFIIEGDGKRLGTGAVLRDVTREREVDRMKTEFISIVSHELRTPMTAVYGFASLLLNSSALAEEHQEWVRWIHQESQRLTDILEDLLNVSRIEAGRLSLKLEAVALEPVIADIIAQLGHRYPSHSFKANIPGSFPGIRADVDKLTQALYNLIDNAAKYSPQGGPVVVSVRRGKKHGQAVISVADRGLGIPKQEIPKLFSRFHRIQSPETTGIRGTGLGLYIVKSLVEIMGGQVWLKSQEGQGCTFYLSLPFDDVLPSNKR